MSDKPILFSGPMVRALLAGTKTQTRRAKGLPAIEGLAGGWHIHNRHGGTLGVAEDDIGRVAADYYRIQPGDRLYVREAWRTPVFMDKTPPRDLPVGTELVYHADDEISTERYGKYRQAMHMPRWASRITLHVTEVRVQRLQEISEEDARAEGVDEMTCYRAMGNDPNPPMSGPHWALGYSRLWNAINGPGAWEANPWVAAITFVEVERCNIAQARNG